MKKINLHTHSTFCDGHNSVEENILAAINKGFDVLGFSSHSMWPLAGSWHIAPRNFEDYEVAVRAASEKYQIKILCGFEADYIPGVSLPSYDFYRTGGIEPDFLIGAVHYVATGRGTYTVDNSAEHVRENLLRLYGKKKIVGLPDFPVVWDDFIPGKALEKADTGDGNCDGGTCGEGHVPSGIDSSAGDSPLVGEIGGRVPLADLIDSKAAVCDYFAAERELLRKGNFDILAHPDLIRKRNGVLQFFEEGESWYRSELQETAKAAAKAGVVVEINTGGIARGATTSPYPSPEFLELLHDRGVPVCYSSDSHDVKTLDFGYEMACDYARKAGYKEFVYPIDGKRVSVGI